MKIFLKLGILFFFLFCPSTKAQQYELTCPAGSRAVDTLTSLNTNTGLYRQNYCVDAKGNVFENVSGGANLVTTQFNTVLYAPQFCSPGSTDIDACASNAFNSAQCAALSVGPKQCEVHIGSGTLTGWTTSTSISITMQNSGGAKLVMDGCPIINYLGSSDWLQFFATGAGNNNNFILDMGCGAVVGTSAGANCLHFRQVGVIKTYNATCRGFTNTSDISKGNGELNEGVVSLMNFAPLFTANNLAIRNVGYSGGPGTISPAVNIWNFGGRFQANITGGAFEDGSCTAACSFPNENNGYQTDIEGNGSSNPVTTGSLTASLTANVVTITGAGTANNITAGTIALQSGFAGGTVPLGCVNGRWPVSTATSNTYTYTCAAANGSGTGSGTVTGQKYQVFIENGNGISIQPTLSFMQWANGTSGFEAQIELGDSNWTPHGTYIQAFLSSVGSTNSIFSFGSVGTIIVSTYEFNNVTNFYNCGISTNTNLNMAGNPPSNSAATNYISGCGGITAVALRTILCGTTSTCSQLPFISPVPITIIGGPIALAAGTLTITSLPFTSSTSYVCSPDDSTGINGIDVIYNSGSSVTFNGTGTDSIRYTCTGN